jgi:hypothetical protein
LSSTVSNSDDAAPVLVSKRQGGHDLDGTVDPSPTRDPELAWGDSQLLTTDVAAVFAHRCDWDGGTVIAVHNLAAEPCHVRIDLEAVDEGTRLDDLLDERPAIETLDDNSVELTLEAFGYRWYRLIPPDHIAPP